MYWSSVARRVLVLILVIGSWGVSFADDPSKVVVIGFDGADARLVEKWMDEGHLPNLSKLKDEGTFAPLEPTNPPQTPVSWSTFATGTNPGKTEIFDFLKRDPNDYLPDFAMASETKRTFMFGENNGVSLGLMAALAAMVLAVLGLSLISPSWKVRLGLGLLIAVAAGGCAGYVANTYLPREIPDAVNNRKGRTMWELAGNAGKKVQVIRVPATFPAEPIDGGHMLSGLGVPDMRGRVGTPAFYTSDPAFKGGSNEFSLELLRLPARRGTIKTRIVGPYNKPFYDYVVAQRTVDTPDKERAKAERAVRRELDDAGIARRIDLPLTLEASDSELTLSVAGQTQTLEVGDWSDWVELTFPVNAVVDRLQPLKGIARFKLLQLEPELELYLSPLSFHPDCHPVAFSWPPDYSEEIKERFGLYKTIGWALDTWSLPSGVGDEELFLEDMSFTVAKYEELMEGLLAEGQNDLYIQIFYFPDRIGHLFWQYMDDEHPLHDPVRAERYRGEMLAAYKKMDEIVGRARELAGPDVLFLVCSDHGFSSFRRGVNYNNWLVENGFMTLKGKPGSKATLEKLFDTKDLFGDVDWSRTKAYAMGLGSIYINLAGREKHGIVLPGPEYDEVVGQIKAGLEALVDDTTGARPVRQVYTRDEMYSGYREELIPDLRAASDLNYRVSWQTSLGGFGETVIEDNKKAWSGDHCSNDPQVVPGIFFSNRPINTEHPRMLDIMPTVLKALDVPAPPEVDGRPLF